MGMKDMVTSNTACGYTRELRYQLDHPTFNPIRAKRPLVDLFIFLPHNDDDLGTWRAYVCKSCFTMRYHG